MHSNIHIDAWCVLYMSHLHMYICLCSYRDSARSCGSQVTVPPWQLALSVGRVQQSIGITMDDKVALRNYSRLSVPAEHRLFSALSWRSWPWCKWRATPRVEAQGLLGPNKGHAVAGSSPGPDPRFLAQGLGFCLSVQAVQPCDLGV